MCVRVPPSPCVCVCVSERYEVLVEACRKSDGQEEWIREKCVDRGIFDD